MENSAEWSRCPYQTKNTICVGAFSYKKQHFAWLVLVRKWFSAGFLSTCAREEKRTIILHSGFQSEQEWRHNAFHSLVGLFATKVAVSWRLQKNCLFVLRSDCKPVKSTLTSTENVYGLLLVENSNCVKGKKRKLWMLQCDTGVSRKTVSTELVTWQSQTTTRYSVKCSIRSDKVFVLSSVIQ